MDLLHQQSQHAQCVLGHRPTVEPLVDRPVPGSCQLAPGGVIAQQFVQGQRQRFRLSGWHESATPGGLEQFREGAVIRLHDRHARRKDSSTYSPWAPDTRSGPRARPVA